MYSNQYNLIHRLMWYFRSVRKDPGSEEEESETEDLGIGWWLEDRLQAFHSHDGFR